MKHKRQAHRVTIPYAVLRRTIDRKLHIADFNIIIKILYPYRQSINKYKALLGKTTFTQEQQQLVLDTAHSITILNELHRDQDKYSRYYTVREDMANAIYMLQNELHLHKQEYILPIQVRYFYTRLLEHHQVGPFTAKQVRLGFRLGKTTVNRYLNELCLRGFIAIIDRNSKGFIYKLVDIAK